MLLYTDGVPGKCPVVMDKLISEGAMPVCAGLFLSPGILKSPQGDYERCMRGAEYDEVGRDNDKLDIPAAF